MTLLAKMAKLAAGVKLEVLSDSSVQSATANHPICARVGRHTRGVTPPVRVMAVSEIDPSV
jgi:hypothetical protein